ncbi:MULTISPECIES: helix-turn-helix domain-containing protein [Halomicrobium]|uniref:Bacterio-opsin activator HTH domain protein n=2 Tax=Halomicrobium mukohataei TaxID=57705 RepID=C7P365_HALMD|nr:MULTISPECIES: helix-turn-helix domain-containing protein [Halomicrobium]ACV47537.1 Bacterio-opsin activator HTH domain protein [Halomicrobium mukohataei DSM 12286]QCD66000.1 bacterio-opsin activator [Halomicrobium mukohataei]QFR20805.1 bacterio-opsin activator [Halomicrobium sp. ZPS1]
MRYVTVRVEPREGTAFHPLGQALSDAEDITREAIHRVELLDDGSGVMLAEARGNRDHYEAILDDSDYVCQYAVTGTEGRWYAYCQFDPNEANYRMLQHRQESTVMMEMPIEVHPTGAMEITFVGDEGAFSEAVPSEGEAFEIELLETGQRPPRGEDLFACLTDRQQTILETAIELGYYENPREATQAEIADAVDATAGTVGEHLRKIEHRVFSQFVDPDS